MEGLPSQHVGQRHTHRRGRVGANELPCTTGPRLAPGSAALRSLSPSIPPAGGLPHLSAQPPPPSGRPGLRNTSQHHCHPRARPVSVLAGVRPTGLRVLSGHGGLQQPATSSLGRPALIQTSQGTAGQTRPQVRTKPNKSGSHSTALGVLSCKDS